MSFDQMSVDQMFYGQMSLGQMLYQLNQYKITFFTIYDKLSNFEILTTKAIFGRYNTHHNVNHHNDDQPNAIQHKDTA